MSSMVKEPPQRWRLLDLSYPTPFENLALEETLSIADTKSFQPTVRLWVNPPTVVVGRFQQVESEVDVGGCRQLNVRIARRFTGGGAVFHDEGNLNVTLVTRRPEGIQLGDLFKLNASILLDSLEYLGVSGDFVPPNSIYVRGRKISGAAAALNRNVALWHASILVSTNIQLLNQVLAPSKGARAQTHFIPSEWHPVTTLRECTEASACIDEVKNQLVKSTERVFKVTLENNPLSDDERTCMNQLYTRKYSTQSWNLYGKCAQTPG